MICILFIIGMIVLLLCNIWAFIYFKKQTKKALEEHDEEMLKDIDRRRGWIDRITFGGVAFCSLAVGIHTLLN